MHLRLTVSTDLIGSSKQSECEWLEWVYELLKKETIDDEDYIPLILQQYSLHSPDLLLLQQCSLCFLKMHIQKS